MSVFDSAKTFQRWCAAVCSDYEVLLNHYLTADGLDFQVFRFQLEKCGTNLLHHSAVGKGKSGEEHYRRITRILIQTAKDFWLRHPMTKLFQNLDDDEFLSRPISPSRLKSVIGGFYLTVAMLGTIPTQTNNTPNKFRLFLDSQDLVAFYYFRKCFIESSIPDFVKIQIQYMLFTLNFQDSFELCSESLQTGINPNIRNLRNIMDSNLSRMNYAVKDLQNSSIHPSRANKIMEELQKVESSKVAVKKSASKGLSAIQEAITTRYALKTGGSAESGMNKGVVPMSHGSASTSLDSSRNVGLGDTLPDVLNAVTLSARHVDTPVLSVTNFLANAIADRAMMSECRKRAERSARNRTAEAIGTPAAEEGAEGTRVRKTQPYVEEGGIFGRKNINDDNKPRVDKNSAGSEPAETARNLWDYINTGYFGGGRLAPEEHNDNHNHGGDGGEVNTTVGDEAQASTSTSAAAGSGKIEKIKRKSNAQ